MATYPIHPAQNYQNIFNLFPAVDTEFLTPRVLNKLKLIRPKDMAQVGFLKPKDLQLVAQGKLRGSINNEAYAPFVKFADLILPNLAYKGNFPSIMECHPDLLNDPLNHFIWFGAVSPWGLLNPSSKATNLRTPYPVVAVKGRTSNLRIGGALMTKNYKSRCLCGSHLCLNVAHWNLDIEQIRRSELTEPPAPMKPDFQVELNLQLSRYL